MKTAHDEHRITLAHLPTPLEPMASLSRQLDARLYIKRDDCTGLAFGGNKARKLEFVMGEALRAGCDSVVTSGAIQSNHVRQTAAACVRLGLRCHVVLSNPIDARREDWLQSGNVLLDQILGASVTVVDESETEATLASIMAREASLGHTPYLVPVGASNAVGALGYLHCAREILDQARTQGLDLSHVVLATGSAGTHAGLLYGLKEAGADVRVTGISVSEPAAVKCDKVRRLCHELAELRGQACPVDEADITVYDDYVGEGYALDTPAARAATLLLARTEAILLDPVYTSKAFAGLLDLVDRDPAYRARDVLFLHTGGAPAIFACVDRHAHGA